MIKKYTDQFNIEKKNLEIQYNKDIITIDEFQAATTCLSCMQAELCKLELTLHLIERLNNL